MVVEHAAERRGQHLCDHHGCEQPCHDLPCALAAVVVEHYRTGDDYAGGPARRLDDAPGNEPFDPWGHGAECRAPEQEHHSRQEHRAPAEAVGEPAIGQRGERNAQHEQRRRKLRSALAHAEPVADRRRGRQEDLERRRPIVVSTRSSQQGAAASRGAVMGWPASAPAGRGWKAWAISWRVIARSRARRPGAHGVAPPPRRPRRWPRRRA